MHALFARAQATRDVDGAGDAAVAPSRFTQRVLDTVCRTRAPMTSHTSPPLPHEARGHLTATTSSPSPHNNTQSNSSSTTNGDATVNTTRTDAHTSSTHHFCPTHFIAFFEVALREVVAECERRVANAAASAREAQVRLLRGTHNHTLHVSTHAFDNDSDDDESCKETSVCARHVVDVHGLALHATHAPRDDTNNNDDSTRSCCRACAACSDDGSSGGGGGSDTSGLDGRGAALVSSRYADAQQWCAHAPTRRRPCMQSERNKTKQDGMHDNDDVVDKDKDDQGVSRMTARLHTLLHALHAHVRYDDAEAPMVFIAALAYLSRVTVQCVSEHASVTPTNWYTLTTTAVLVATKMYCEHTRPTQHLNACVAAAAQLPLPLLNRREVEFLYLLDFDLLLDDGDVVAWAHWMEALARQQTLSRALYALVPHSSTRSLAPSSLSLLSTTATTTAATHAASAQHARDPSSQQRYVQQRASVSHARGCASVFSSTGSNYSNLGNGLTQSRNGSSLVLSPPPPPQTTTTTANSSDIAHVTRQATPSSSLSPRVAVMHARTTPASQLSHAQQTTTPPTRLPPSPLHGVVRLTSASATRLFSVVYGAVEPPSPPSLRALMRAVRGGGVVTSAARDGRHRHDATTHHTTRRRGAATRAARRAADATTTATTTTTTTWLHTSDVEDDGDKPRSHTTHTAAAAAMLRGRSSSHTSLSPSPLLLNASSSPPPRSSSASPSSSSLSSSDEEAAAAEAVGRRASSATPPHFFQRARERHRRLRGTHTRAAAEEDDKAYAAATTTAAATRTRQSSRIAHTSDDDALATTTPQQRMREQQQQQQQQQNNNSNCTSAAARARLRWQSLGVVRRVRDVLDVTASLVRGRLHVLGAHDAEDERRDVGDVAVMRGATTSNARTTVTTTAATRTTTMITTQHVATPPPRNVQSGIAVHNNVALTHVHAHHDDRDDDDDDDDEYDEDSSSGSSSLDEDIRRWDALMRRQCRDTSTYYNNNNNNNNSRRGEKMTYNNNNNNSNKKSSYGSGDDDAEGEQVEDSDDGRVQHISKARQRYNRYYNDDDDDDDSDDDKAAQQPLRRPQLTHSPPSP